MVKEGSCISVRQQHSPLLGNGKRNNNKNPQNCTAKWIGVQAAKWLFDKHSREQSQETDKQSFLKRIEGREEGEGNSDVKEKDKI